MSSDQNDNANLVSLKELKDITQEAAEQPQRQAVKPKERRTSSFIDDADSLLADIRSEVEDVVTTGAAALKDRKTANLEALELQRREQELRRQEEIDAQLAAEAARRRAAAEEREQQRRTLSGDVEEDPGHEQESNQSDQEQFADPPQSAPVFEPEPPPSKKSAGFYVAVVGLPLLIGGAVFAFFGLGDEQKPPIVKTAAPATKSTIGNAPAEPTVTSKPAIKVPTATQPSTDTKTGLRAEADTGSAPADDKTKKPVAAKVGGAKKKTKSGRSKSRLSKKARVRARKIAAKKAKQRRNAKAKKAGKPKKKRDQLKLNLGGF